MSGRRVFMKVDMSCSHPPRYKLVFVPFLEVYMYYRYLLMM